MSNQNRVQAGVPTGGQFAASERAEATSVSLAAPDQSADPFIGSNDADGYNRAALRGVSAYLATNPPFGDEVPPAKQHVANALSFTGVTPEPDIVDAIHERLYTGAFTDEEGDHNAQAWSALDADDRFSGEFTTFTATRNGVRMSADEGDASSFANPGFSWRVEKDGHFYSGQADTIQRAQRDAVSTADYITSGRAEADYWDDLDRESEGIG